MFDAGDYAGLDLLTTNQASAFRIIDDLVWDLWGRRQYYEEYWEIEDLPEGEAKAIISQQLLDWDIDPEAPSLEIDRFQVASTLRGQGLGSKAYYQIERDAKRAGLKYIILQASIIDFDSSMHSLPFWLKMGFSALPQTTDYPIMVKAI